MQNTAIIYNTNKLSHVKALPVLGGCLLLSAAVCVAQVLGNSAILHHLNGKEALSYAQIRKLDSDFGRTQRQRTVMEALYKKFQYADTDTLMKLFQEVLPYLSTNMTNGQIMRLAAKCIPAFGSIELHSYCVPANDSFYYASIREMSVLVPDLDKIRGQLENEYLPLN